MAKLTASQVAAMVGVSAYTIKRWYNWFENLTTDEIGKYVSKGMPILPSYETIGTNNWRYWEETDIEQLKRFKEWVPHTKRGVFQKTNRKEN